MASGIHHIAINVDNVEDAVDFLLKVTFPYDKQLNQTIERELDFKPMTDDKSIFAKQQFLKIMGNT